MYNLVLQRKCNPSQGLFCVTLKLNYLKGICIWDKKPQLSDCENRENVRNKQTDAFIRIKTPKKLVNK